MTSELDQAISGENFSQSEYVAFGAISQFAFPPLAKAIHRAFDYVNLFRTCVANKRSIP